jgi:hypothetical protein
MQSHEAQPRGLPDHPAMMQRLAPLAEDREIDPGKARLVSGAPDDVRHVEHSAVLQHREAVAHTGGSGQPLDPRGGKIIGFDPDQRPSL